MIYHLLPAYLDVIKEKKNINKILKFGQGYTFRGDKSIKTAFGSFPKRGLLYEERFCSLSKLLPFMVDLEGANPFLSE